LERQVAKMELHRPGLGDLFDLVEIARSTVPIANAPPERGSREEAARDLINGPGGAQTVDGLIEVSTSAAVSATRRCNAIGCQREPVMDAAEGKTHQSTVKPRIRRAFPLEYRCRPLLRGNVLARGQQQVAILIASHRIEHRIFGLML